MFFVSPPPTIEEKKLKMLSVFDRIRDALAQGIALSKTDLFREAKMPNTESNRALFQILVQNNKLIKIGERRNTKYCLPLFLDNKKLPEEGLYKFQQVLDGKIIFIFNDNEPITFSSYDEFVLYVKGKLIC